MSVYTRPNSPFYWFEFWHKGERFRGSTECTEKRAAESFERAERDRVKREFAGGKPSPAMTLDIAVGKYWEQVGLKTAKPEELFANLERIQDWIGPATALKDIDEALLAGLIQRRAAEYRRGDKKLGRVSPSTVNRSFTMIVRRILTRARVTWKIPLAEVDWKQLMLGEPEERVRELSMDEEARLEAAELPEYTPLRRFAQATGFRRRSALISWDQVNWSTGKITVVQKGGKRHSLPISTELRELLWPLYLKRAPNIAEVFTYVARKTRMEPRSKRLIKRGVTYPITYEGWQSAHDRACKRAGVVDFRIHDERHTAASRTLRGTGNLAVVQKLLGHKRIGTTVKYAHVMDDDLKKAMDARAADEVRMRAESEERAREAEVAKITHIITHTATDATPKALKYKRKTKSE